MHYLAKYYNLSLEGEGAKMSAIFEKKWFFWEIIHHSFSDSIINTQKPHVGPWYDIRLSENTKLGYSKQFFQILEPKMLRGG